MFCTSTTGEITKNATGVHHQRAGIGAPPY
jgi:hypothetical protein